MQVLAAVAEKLGNGDYAYQANPYGDYFEEGDEQDTNAEEEEDGWLLVDSSPKDAKPTDAIMLEVRREELMQAAPPPNLDQSAARMAAQKLAAVTGAGKCNVSTDDVGSQRKMRSKR
eukprot:gene24533-29843_t